MQWLKTIVRELFGLFVDDGSFALAIIIWLGVVGLALPHAQTDWRGAMLFGGLALILLESATRQARR